MDFKYMLKKIGNNLAYILIGLVLAIAGTVYAYSVSVPNSTQKGNYLTGLSTGNYQTNAPCSNGQILTASSTSSSGWACVANTAALGATTTITSNVLINGPSFTFATSTSGGLTQYITGSGNTITWTLQPSSGYNIPLSASTTQWSNLYNNIYTTVNISTGTAGNTFNIATSTNSLTINCPTASGSNSGCLASGDWTTFNGKQNALTLPLSIPNGGTGVNNLTAKDILFGNGNSIIGTSTNLTWDGAVLAVTGSATISSTLNVTSTSTLASTTVTNLINSSVKSALVLNGATGIEGAYGGASNPCSANQAPTTLSALGVLGGCTSTFLTGNQTITVSGAMSGSGATSIALAFNSTTPVAYGGTGAPALTANDILFGNGTNPVGTSTNLTWDGKTLAVTGSATVSSLLTAASTTITGTLSVSGVPTLSGVSNCNGSQFLQITTGLFGCGTPAGGGGSLTGTTTSDQTSLGVGANITTSGSDDTFIGYQSGYSDTGGNYNVALGSQSLYSNLGGAANVAIGFQSLFNTGTTGNIGNDNIAIGNQSLYTNNGSDASRNIAIGSSSLYHNTGKYNTVIGYQAYSTATSSSNSVAFGYYAGRYEIASNAFYVNNVNQTSLANDKAYSLLYGNFAGSAGTTAGQFLTINAATTTANGNLIVTGNVGIGTTTASAKLFVQAGSGIIPFTIASSTGSTLFQVTGSGATVLNGLTYTWPSSQSGTKILQNDGSGNLSWVAQSAGGGGSGGGWATSTPAYITTTYPNTTGALVGINSSTPTAQLTVEGTAGTTTPIFTVASSSNTSYLNVTSIGNVNIATLTASSLVGTDANKNLAPIIATSTGWVTIDGQGGNSLQTGSVNFPYHSISGALASAVSSAAYAYNLIPNTTYIDGAPDTFPSVPFQLQGNEATYVPASGVTFPGSFDIYDLTIVGNVTESDNSLNFIHQFNNGVISGNLTLAGNATLNGMAVIGTTSTISTLAGSLVNLEGSLDYAHIIANGIQTNLNDDFIQISTTTSNSLPYAITSTSTGAIVPVNGLTLINTGANGGGFYLQNGATSTPNILTNLSILVNSSTPGSTINCGSSACVVGNVVGMTNLTGTFIPPTGSNWVPFYDEDRSVLNTLSVGTSTITSNPLYVVGNANFATLTPSALVGTDANRNLVGEILLPGSNITIATSTLGQITISSTGGGGSGVGTTTPFTNGQVPYATSTLALTDSPIITNGTVVGINGTSSTYALKVKGISSGTLQVSDSSNNDLFHIGSAGTFAYDANVFTDSAGFYGIYSDPLFEDSTNTNSSNLYGFYNSPSLNLLNNATNTITNYYDQINQFTNFAGTVTNYIGLRIQAPTISGGLITNKYGLIVDAGLPVGIGSSTPSAILSIQGTSGSTNDIFDVASSSNSLLLQVASNGSTTLSSLATAGCVNTTATGSLYVAGCASGGGGSGVGTTTPFTAGYIPEATSTSAGVVLSNSNIYQSAAGLIGIATSSPTTALFVQGSGGTNPFAIASSTGTNLVTVLQNGNVGIGTSAPTSALTISGNTFFSGYEDYPLLATPAVPATLDRVRTWAVNSGSGSTQFNFGNASGTILSIEPNGSNHQTGTQITGGYNNQTFGITSNSGTLDIKAASGNQLRLEGQAASINQQYSVGLVPSTNAIPSSAANYATQVYGVNIVPTVTKAPYYTALNIATYTNNNYATNTSAEVSINAPTEVDASGVPYTLLNDSALSISGPPISGSNYTISSSSAITIQGGSVAGSGTTTNAYGLYLTAPTGAATGNYAAVFNGGNVGIGTTTPQATLTLQGGASQTQDLFDIASSSGAILLSVASNPYTTFSFGTSTTGLAVLMVQGQTASTTLPLFTLASSSGTTMYQVDPTGHVHYGGTTPTVSSCGTGSPSVTGNDTLWNIVTGTGSPTACTLTFANPYKSVICVVTDDLQTSEVSVTATSTTAITMTMSAALTSHNIYGYCADKQ